MKKLIALLMCMALLAVCFVACGDKDEDVADTGSDAATTTAASDEGETTKAPDEGEDPEVDEGEMYGTDKDPYVQDLDSWD